MKLLQLHPNPPEKKPLINRTHAPVISEAIDYGFMKGYNQAIDDCNPEVKVDVEKMVLVGSEYHTGNAEEMKKIAQAIARAIENGEIIK